MVEMRYLKTGANGLRLQYLFMMNVNPTVSVWSEWHDIPTVEA